MKYKILILLFALTSCVQNNYIKESKKPFNAKGFAFIYDENDYLNKSINKKLNSNLFQIAHSELRPGSLIKIINIKTNDSIILMNTKNIKYPDFYKILITEPVANKLNLNDNLPLVELIEIKKNKSFIAKKAKIFNEEKRIHSNAPIEDVKIDNISKVNNGRKKEINDKLYINIADFYSKESAQILFKRIKNELIGFDSKKIKIKTKKTNKISLLSGPYNSINLMKNDYIQLKNFGFEDLDISINE